MNMHDLQGTALKTVSLIQFAAVVVLNQEMAFGCC